VKIALRAVLKSGYAILPLEVPSSIDKRKITMELTIAQNSNSWESIFNTKFVEENEAIKETGRFQLPIPTSSESLRIIQQHVVDFFGNEFQLFKPIYLLSEIGCDAQRLHRDYKRSSISK
jgi:hypothetical protein